MTVQQPAWADIDGVLGIVADAQDGFESTLEQLAGRAALSGAPVLEVVTWLHVRLASLGVELRPPVGAGGFADVRVVIAAADLMSTAASTLVDQGEGHHQEFKSSLYYDRKLAEENPDATDKELRAKFVLDSSLKTVAAFANSDGGDLWVGVADDHEVLGLADDCRILSFSF